MMAAVVKDLAKGRALLFSKKSCEEEQDWAAPFLSIPAKNPEIQDDRLVHDERKINEHGVGYAPA